MATLRPLEMMYAIKDDVQPRHGHCDALQDLDIITQGPCETGHSGALGDYEMATTTWFPGYDHS